MENNNGVFLYSLLPVSALVLSLSFPVTEMPSAEPVQVQSELSAPAKTPPRPTTPKTAAAFTKDVDWFSGPRTSVEMDSEWATWVGTSTPIQWSHFKTKENLRLSMVIIDLQDLANNPLRVMHIHTLGSEFGQDDAVTYFNRQVDGPEERNFLVDLVIPHEISAPLRAEASPELKDKSRYLMRLQESAYKRPFDLRDPRVQTELQMAEALDFDVLSEFIAGASLNEKSGFEREVDWNGQVYSVLLEIRQTELDTLAFELHLRAVDSLQSLRVGLIYE